jgi:hypothetical protein
MQMSILTLESISIEEVVIALIMRKKVGFCF